MWDLVLSLSSWQGVSPESMALSLKPVGFGLLTTGVFKLTEWDSGDLEPSGKFTALHMSVLPFFPFLTSYTQSSSHVPLESVGLHFCTAFLLFPRPVSLALSLGSSRHPAPTTKPLSLPFQCLGSSLSLPCAPHVIGRNLLICFIFILHCPC